jgi:SWI/SNF-related matrix-associated actin-dependent regulator of chromatin subfamily A member 5
MEEEKIMQRNRKATTVTVEEKGVGKIQISKWSIEEAEKERLQMEREKARIEAKKIGGNKRVTEHDMSCLHCHESVLKQRVIVTREIDDEGNEVKRRKIDSDTSGYQACPICPATLHYNCLRLAVHGSEFTVRSNCPQHKCRVCRRSASNAGGLLFRCTECPMALCYDCIEKYELVEKFKFIERENVKWEKSMGYTAASTYEYMHCPECMHQSLAKRAIHQVKGEVSSESKDIVMSDQ